MRRWGRAVAFHRVRLGISCLALVAVVAGALGADAGLRKVRESKERDWLAAFHQGESLLEAEIVAFGSDPSQRTKRLEQAAARFADCCAIDPNRWEARLRRAEAALLLGDRGLARDVVVTARREGAHGWYADQVEARSRGEAVCLPPFAEGAAANVSRGWSALDRVALARELLRSKRHCDALEILLDPVLLDDRNLLVAAEIASFLHRDLALGGPTYLYDGAAQARLALRYYDRALERDPDLDLVRLGRAIFIRDELTFHRPLGADPVALLESAIADLRALADRLRSAAARAALANAFLVASRIDDGLEIVDELDDEELRTVPFPDQVAIVKLLAAGHRLERAFTLLSAPGFVPPWGRDLGPLGRLVLVVEFVRSHYGEAAPDFAELERFVTTVRDRVTAQDWDSARHELERIRPR